MRYLCEFPRKDLRLDTESRISAENWLREQDSEGAHIIDTQRGDRAKLDPNGHLVWKERNIASNIRHTHTYAVLSVSKACYDEIHGRLTAAGYTHAFHQTRDGAVIDMQGIALQQDVTK